MSLDRPNDHAPEQWLRAALDQASPPLRRAIRVIHRHVIRFDLERSEAAPFLGWHLLTAERDFAAIETDGSLLRAVLVARRRSPTLFSASTYLFFHKTTAARLMWLWVRPLHLLAERYLLSAAARTLAESPSNASAGR